MVRLKDLPIYEQEHLLSKLLPPLGPLPWVVNNKSLNKKKIAMITTAGLNYRNEENFNFADASFRAIPTETESKNLLMTHSSVNFDRTGFQEDLNIVFPIDRFKELEDEGFIGSLASINYSFMGAGLLPDAYEKSVRSLAKILKQDDVDAVFILPVCPNCSRSVCGISYYLESEGIQTTGITLVREIAESMKPPRLLWVSFPLGRPLGKPNDEKFQKKVIRQSLELLSQQKGPILEDCLLELNEDNSIPPPACPISFKKHTDENSWYGRLHSEVSLMMTWYDLSLKRRNRTTVGASKSTIMKIVKGLTAWIDDPETSAPKDIAWLKFALEDLKAFYGESLTAQPGNYNAGYVDNIIFHETVLGELIAYYFEFFESDPETQPFARTIASREQVKRSTGSWAINKKGEMTKLKDNDED